LRHRDNGYKNILGKRPRWSSFIYNQLAEIPAMARTNAARGWQQDPGGAAKRLSDRPATIPAEGHRITAASFTATLCRIVASASQTLTSCSRIALKNKG
jgi:hypothetical protein